MFLKFFIKIQNKIKFYELYFFFFLSCEKFIFQNFGYFVPSVIIFKNNNLFKRKKIQKYLLLYNLLN